jgi:UDP-N-acetyl-D-mannosaminuronic acid dehydrogenase
MDKVKKMQKLCIVGLGYIGLPTACLFATHGHQVIGVDTREEAVEKVQRGEVPFQESGLEELLKKSVKSGNLIAKTEPEVTDVFLIAVPTPLDKKTRAADLSHVQHATERIVDYLRKGSMVILESTVPPGTGQRLVVPVLEKSGLEAGRDFHMVHCPERAIPGNTIHEMIYNDRIIGGINRKSAERAKDLYTSFVRGNFYLTNFRTAEIVKLMENTYRDINIALANEFAQIAEQSGVDIWEAIELSNKHPRVDILSPGPGVGGHCLAVDPWFLAGNSARSRIIALAREINDSMPAHVLGLVRELLKDTKEAIITVLGVAYKGDVDDSRETPALSFITLAKSQGYQVKAYDPFVKKFESDLYPLEQAVQDSDCLVVITNHSEFKQLDPVKVMPLMRSKNLVDTRNILDPKKWRDAGFKVTVLGNGAHRYTFLAR